MPKEQDPFRKYVQDLEKRKWRCKFCSIVFAGSTPRIRAHLAGIPGKGIKACKEVTDAVRAEALETFKGEGSGLDNSTGGTTGEGTRGTDTQNSNQLGCTPQQGCLPPDDRPLDNLDTSQPSSLLYLSETPAQPDLSTHLEFEGDVLPTPLLNKITLTCISPDSDGEDPGSAEQFANEVLLDSLPGTAPARPQDQESLYPLDRPRDNLDNTQQSDPSNCRSDAAHRNENASSPQQSSMDRLASISELLDPLEQSTHLESGDEFTPDAPVYSPESIGHHFLPENLRESLAKVFEDIEAGVLHNPEEVDGTNRLQDCGQPRGVEEVPMPSNRSPTDTVQHPCQLIQRCDKEDANDIPRFPSQTPIVIDPSTALQHLSDSHIFEATNVHLLVPGASTNPIDPSSSHASVRPQRQIVPHRSINLQTAHQNPTVPSSSWENRLVTGHPQAPVDMDPCMPSSSQSPNHAPPPPQILPCGTDLISPSSLPESDMNEGAPMTSHPNAYNIFEESGALKRKLKQLFSKEAHIREELKFGASLSLKKPRIEVANWLVDVEKLRNDCLLPYQVDILMCEAEDLWRQGKGLFETRETKVNNLIEEKMVGKAFQRNTTKILQYLEGNKISQLGIYGMGGVGKTTIMVHIHNRLKKANYGNVIWITVSQDFKTQMLQDAIGKEIGLSISQEKDVRKRAAILCDCLTKRGKSTIILDDVWEHFDFNEVGIPVGADGIKLVLTTRSLEVCRQMHCQEMIKIEPLSQMEAKSLFLEELGSKLALNLEIEAIVKSIVRECAGLPLAIITMARSMYGVADVFEWRDSLEKLRESNMGQMDMEKKVLMKLKFSYDRLGNHEVQQCFLSCALYPEDYSFFKFELIEFFIDQGLIGPLSTRKKQFDRGLTILNKLANVCLLEVHGSMMKMHDLIRDMALHVMNVTSIVKTRKGLRNIPSEEHWTDALEKVSLMANDIEEFPSNREEFFLNISPNCPKLSTFLLNGIWRCHSVIPNSFFKHLWGLKVLNLSYCSLRELPDSISNLVNLTSLLLRGCCRLRRIPHLGKLRSLRKLDIFCCVEFEALEGLDKLVNLRYLDIISTSIKRLPKGTLGALLNLQCLRARLVNGEEITKLRALETLECFFDNVDDFNKFVRALSKQGNNPWYYDIKVNKEFANFSTADVGVHFQDCKRSVSIQMRSNAIVSARGESSGSGSGICILIPQDVRNLVAYNCDSGTNLSDMGLLEKLEVLKIRCWSNLWVLCGGQGEEVIDIHDSPTRTPTPLVFPSLRDLSICVCPKLKYLFGHEPKFSLPHLRSMKIFHCMEIVGITMVATSPPPYPPPAFPSLEEIIVNYCKKMKRVVEFEWLPHFPNLRRIKVHNCENMEEIIGGLSPYMSIEGISPERLLVKGCHELPLHLRNLQTIQVIGCKGMVEIISRAGQGQEGSMTTPVYNTPSSSQSSISLPKLNSLVLEDLPQLKSICEVLITCNSMKHLEVIGCPELNRIPLKLQIRDIENLPYIVVEGKEKWKTLIWDHPDAQALLHFLYFTRLVQIMKKGNPRMLLSKKSC